MTMQGKSPRSHQAVRPVGLPACAPWVCRSGHVSLRRPARPSPSGGPARLLAAARLKIDQASSGSVTSRPHGGSSGTSILKDASRASANFSTASPLMTKLCVMLDVAMKHTSVTFFHIPPRNAPGRACAPVPRPGGTTPRPPRGKESLERGLCVRVSRGDE